MVMKTDTLEADLAKMRQDIVRYQAVAVDSANNYHQSTLDSLGKIARIAGLWLSGCRGPMAYFKGQVYSQEKQHITQLKSAENHLGQLMEDIDSAFRLIPSEE